MIKANAGRMRGVRVMRDPDGILFDSFTDDSGEKYGYVIVYGEGSPAVHDGTQWHPITEMSDDEWADGLQDNIVKQGIAIATAAQGSPIYAELAKVMQIFVGADTRAPSDSTVSFQ
jgi:hypothetical protein